MKTRLLIAALALSVLAIPVAVPASQPADVRLGELLSPVVAVPDPVTLRTLLANPKRTAELSVELPAGFTTLSWIDEDPFAN